MLIIAALIVVGYMNHAGDVIAGWSAKLTTTQVESESISPAERNALRRLNLVQQTMRTCNHLLHGV